MALGATTAAAAVTQLPPNSQLQNYQSATASVTASGSMSYNTGTASGNASESDSNATGELLQVNWARKGYGYDAFASAQNGLVKSYASAIDAGSQGSSSASSSATWTDYFMITGDDSTEYTCYYYCGTNYKQATAVLSASIDGRLAGNNSSGSASFSFTVNYSPISGCSYWYGCGTAENNQSLVSESRSVSGRRAVTVNDQFESEFTFRYNTPFRITAMLNTSAGEGGLADFSHTGSFDLVLPEGATLVSASGLPYGQVSGVPEPESWLMLAAGLGMLGFMASRRHQR
ncbi:PEP-CTERM sorting domain-containing protein [Ideonella sp. DXS22W]|uniref:PEP-CTERM sorting domain-containing protein n=1 Tax=Pseudaquabacterium inlustre TaxID=2984192 RepID=A0ABU9CJ67_9BURK